MDPLTLEQVARDTSGIILRGDPAAVVRGVSTDSRMVDHDQLFVPLVGQRFDGHSFIGDALARGAVGVLLGAGRELPANVSHDAGVIAVDDTLTALQRLAAGQRRRLRKGRVVAVTGSTGKTTTKDMIAAIFADRHRTVHTRGNFNNEIGLPLTLLDADRHTDVLVVEMGMRGPGEIRALAAIAGPHVGVITNVSEVHLERLGSVDNIAAAKRELIEALPEDGVAVLNGDDPLVMAMVDYAPSDVILYGLQPHNDVRASDVIVDGEAGSRFALHFRGQSTTMKLPIPGRHNVMNALAAAGAAFALRLTVDDVAHGLAQITRHRSPMRLDITSTSNGVRVVNDAYNAGPASMAAALELLSTMRGGRRVAVLGDMLELGTVAQQAHSDVGTDVARLGIDQLVAVGDYATTVITAAVGAGMPAERTIGCRDAAEAVDVVRRLVRPGDIVLIKASRGIRLEQVADCLTLQGDEAKAEGDYNCKRERRDER